MRPQAERVPTSTTLLTIQGSDGAWGIPSSAVASVQRLDSHGADAEPPLDLLALLGVPSQPDASANSRVLVLEVHGLRVSLLVHGTLHLAEAAVSELLPLPAAVQAQTPLISHLAVINGKAALFVVSPERLLQAAHSASTALSPDAHASARGSSC